MILSYSLISSILLGFGYITYRLCMAGKRQHALNRWALLSIYASSIILPIIILSCLLHHPEAGAGQETFEIGEVSGRISKPDAGDTLNMTAESVLKLLLGVYIIGVFATSIYFLIGLVTLWRIIERGERKEYGTFLLILADDSCTTAPFSWGRSIVMTRKDHEEYGDMILLHEHAHLRQQHWIDIIIAYSTICLQWYNPVAWAMREELKAVHEYQVDEMVMNTGVDRKEYQIMLLRKATGYSYQPFANRLNNSKLQKRIAMMYEKKTFLLRRLFALTLVPAMGAGIAVTAIPSVAKTLRSIAATSGSDKAEANIAVSDEIPKKREVFIAVEDPAEFPGGMEALMKWLSNNIVYPQEAEKAGIQGRVIVKFVIEADGTVTHPEILRGVSPEIDAEVMRLINSMPKWTPGKNNGTEVASYFTLPVVFRL